VHRRLTSLLVLAAVALVPAAAAAAPQPCGQATDGVYLDTAYGVAARIAENERGGAAVTLAQRTIAGDAVLARAVAAGDIATVESQLIVLLYNHEHIVRISVFRRGRLIDNVGGAFVLAPVYGTLRVAGSVVGTFEFSIQDDEGYLLLAQRLVGADTVMRYQGQTVKADIDVGATPLPERGAVRIGGLEYLVATIDVGAFPTGTLRISLLFPVPVPALASATCVQARADVLGAIAERVYGEASVGPGVTVARMAIARDGALAADLAAGDAAAVRTLAPQLLIDAHVSRLQILDGTRVIADVGTRAQLVAPVTVAVTDASGRVVGSVLITIQSVSGLYAVTSYLTGSFVLVRDGNRQLIGQRRGPVRIPASGPLRYAGAHFNVFSFAGTLFPGGALTIYVLVRD
jgi:hypothetical protein